MAGEPTTVIVGNLTEAPDLRYTGNGAAVANFTVASTPRTYDREAGEWVDGETLFMRCSAWRDLAENLAESLTKGMRVIVAGEMVQRHFETKEGDRRSVIELQVTAVGPDLRYAVAEVSRKVNNSNAKRGEEGEAPARKRESAPAKEEKRKVASGGSRKSAPVADDDFDDAGF